MPNQTLKLTGAAITVSREITFLEAAAAAKGEVSPSCRPAETDRATALGDVIKHEDDQIGQRSTCLVISQSFLFGSLAALSVAFFRRPHRSKRREHGLDLGKSRWWPVRLPS